METDFNQKVYVERIDNKGLPWIEETTLEDVVSKSAELTTNPRGVMPKLYEDEENLMYWEIGYQFPKLIETFETAEECHQEWLERIYERDFLESDDYYYVHDTKEEAIKAISESMELDTEIINSMLKWREVAKKILVNKTITSKISELKKAIENSNGNATKKLQKTYRKIKLYRSINYNDGEYIDIEYNNELQMLIEKAEKILNQ